MDFLFVFIYGLLIGSFINSLIYRMENNLSFIWSRSFCPNCFKNLGFWDLIPVLSFLFLKGKCRYCKKPISFQYPLVEILTGFIFLLVFSHFKNIDILTLIFYLITACFLIIVFVYDLKHYIIPDKIVFPAIGIVFLYRIFEFLKFGFINSEIFFNFLIAAFLSSTFFLIIFLISKGEWMGFGDVKLIFLIGLFLGFPSILVALFSSFVFGAIIGIVLIFLKKKSFESQIPFGPFLVIGAFIGLFWGKEIIDLYLSFSF